MGVRAARSGMHGTISSKARGGAVGVALGTLATVIYADIKKWAVVVPPLALAGGLGAALAVGAIAGLLPAIRAARLSPTEALWTT